MTSTTIDPTQLPATIRAFLAAHAAKEADAAARTFATEVVVVDDGRTFHGAAEVRAFLHEAGTEYTYTTELVGAERLDDGRWVAVNRLEGDFPGGLVELRYGFTLVDDLITELVIEP
ncbi:MAG TPA: nuclear transport factor 2 family protein [Nocardioides sp.]|nr:nuclear transport factor 2 family protein [Nocardioides sp.]